MPIGTREKVESDCLLEMARKKERMIWSVYLCYLLQYNWGLMIMFTGSEFLVRPIIVDQNCR